MYKPGSHIYDRILVPARAFKGHHFGSGRLVLPDFCNVLQLWRTFSSQVISRLFLSASLLAQSPTVWVYVCISVSVYVGMCLCALPYFINFPNH